MAARRLLAMPQFHHTHLMPPATVEHQQQILDQFTRQAEPFALAPAHSEEDSLRLLLDSVGVTSTDNALDVACGPGIVSCALAARARHVTGFDIVPAMLEQARKRQSEKGLQNLDWQLGDAAHLPFADASFSLVVTRYSFHHLLEPGAALREMARVCRPGGRIAVADVTPEADKAEAYDQMETLRDPSHTHALPFQELAVLGAAERLALLNSASYHLDVDLDTLLASCFPPPGNAHRVRQMVRNDIGTDNLSISAYQHEGNIGFRFPISILVWSARNG